MSKDLPLTERDHPESKDLDSLSLLEIVRLSRIVLDYVKSDSQARDIVDKAVEALAFLVRLALQRNPSDHKPYRLAVTGGPLVRSPVHGALYIAAKAIKDP